MTAPQGDARFPPGAALIVAIAAVSTGAVFIRLADAPPLVVAFWRCGLATAVLLALFGRGCAAEWRRLTRTDLWLVVGTGFALALHFAAWISSLSYTSVASSIVIVNTTPLWVALATPLVTSDRVRPLTWAAIGVATLGCIVIGAGDFELSGRALLGDGLALFGAWMCALYMLSGRRLRQTLSLGPYVIACYGVAAVFLFVFTRFSGDSVTGYSGATYGWLACLAVVPQLIGHSSYNYALRYVSAALTSIATLGESVGATLLAWWFLGEVPPLQAVVGGAAVLVGMLIAMRSERA
jgi:drug/metabolite transporter (DMT)-like permease